MKCDHSRLSPHGTVVRYSFVTHDRTEIRWYLACRACGKGIAAGRKILGGKK